MQPLRTHIEERGHRMSVLPPRRGGATTGMLLLAPSRRMPIHLAEIRLTSRGGYSQAMPSRSRSRCGA